MGLCAGSNMGGCGRFSGVAAVDDLVRRSFLDADTTPVDGTVLTKVWDGPVLKANTDYALRMLLKWNSGASVDGKFALEVPSGSVNWSIAIATIAGIVPVETGDPLTVSSGGIARIASASGFIRTGSTAGALELWAADVVNGTQDIVVSAGTWIECVEITATVGL